MLSVVVSRRDIFVWYGVIIEEIIVVDYTATILINGPKVAKFLDW